MKCFRKFHTKKKLFFLYKKKTISNQCYRKYFMKATYFDYFEEKKTREIQQSMKNVECTQFQQRHK